MYKVYHNMSNSVISSMFTKVDLIHVRFTRSLNQNFYVFFLAVLIFADFLSLIMELLFGMHCLMNLKALLLFISLNELLKTVYLLVIIELNVYYNL